MVEIFVAVLMVFVAWLLIACTSAAYENGVRDAGLYFSEPNHPGAKRAKQIIEREI